MQEAAGGDESGGNHLNQIEDGTSSSKKGEGGHWPGYVPSCKLCGGCGDLGTGIPGRNCHGGIGYVTKVEGAGSNTIVSVKYSSTAKIARTESFIPLTRVKAGFLPLHQWRWKATKIQSIPQYQSSMPWRRTGKRRRGVGQSSSASRRGLRIIICPWLMITVKFVLQFFS